jgi:glycerophosphoryl diester phosphodiesterase
MFTTAKSQVAIIAHRGASFLAPENTVASAKLGWELGADAVEIDIHLSKDNRVMVHHDKTTKRQTGTNLNIKESSSDELRMLDAGSFKGEQYEGEKIPFLEEIVPIIPKGKMLVIEIKCDSEVIPVMKEIIEASGKKDQIMFISFGWQTIIDTKKAFPGNKCYWLSSVAPDVKLKIKDAAKKGLDGLDLRNTIIDEKVMKQANKLGLEMLCWTVDDPQEARRMIALGVQGITTNRPGWLREQLNAK